MSKVKLSAKAKTAKEAGAHIEAFCDVIRGGHSLVSMGTSSRFFEVPSTGVYTASQPLDAEILHGKNTSTAP